MHEIVVISGKGGTGKTSITAAFAHVAKKALLCDLDVDAPDLHILLQPEHEREEAFFSGHEAVIRESGCTGCGTCAARCRFGAVSARDHVFRIDPHRCEGCKVCVAFCPEQTIDFVPRHCGTWYQSQTRFGPMIHAQLFPGQENSGRLVSLLKKEARQLATAKGLDLILCDGSPGIGCPVISSLSQASLAVVVTEPTPSGIHDFQRVTALCEHFRIPVAVIINKCDVNAEHVRSIEALCTGRYTVVARLPHDMAVTQAMINRRAVTETECDFGRRIHDAWNTLSQLIHV